MITFARLYGVSSCQCLDMSATTTDLEIKSVVSALGLKEKPVILASSPIQSHIEFSIVRRPSNNYGLDGNETDRGISNPGMMNLLGRLYLNQFLEDLNFGRKPKKCIIFCRRNGVLGAIYGQLMELTSFKYSYCMDSPFVYIQHS